MCSRGREAVESVERGCLASKRARRRPREVHAVIIQNQQPSTPELRTTVDPDSDDSIISVLLIASVAAPLFFLPNERLLEKQNAPVAANRETETSMSAPTVEDVRSSSASPGPSQRQAKDAVAVAPKDGNYKGFVAGVFSGAAKLSVGHPFDTIKVRLQTSSQTQFKGPLDCLMQTLRNEGVRGIYKGATPPLVGWMCMDSLMLGSLTLYRRLLNENIWQPLRARPGSAARDLPDEERKKLPSVGHGVAGMLAGWTVSFIAAPVEHVKARLQVQYKAKKSERLYSGPIDCSKTILRNHGIPGLWHGLFATLIFRTFFFFWWGTYDLFTKEFQKHTSLSTPAINFWAGGLSAQVYWLTSYPSDVVKQQIMTDSLGPDRKYPHWKDAALAVYRKNGWRGYWRGFLPCFLRAFPANAMALVAFEGVMRTLS